MPNNRKQDGLVRVSELVNEALAIEVEEARQAGALGFMARALVQATMPHSKPAKPFFERKNGSFVLTMMAPPSVGGLPYGNIPRLLMAWVTTEAVRDKSPELVLGKSLSEFMAKLGLVPTGGRWGSITRLREQAFRLFGTFVSCVFKGKDPGRALRNALIAEDYDECWWKPRDPNQSRIFEATVRLSERFFQEIIAAPVPIDLRALRRLSRSPLAIDTYVWLTYRMSYLRKQTTIPWPALELQFGSEYGRLRDFKAAFVEHLHQVVTAYPEAKVEPSDAGLILRPSPTHIKLISG